MEQTDTEQVVTIQRREDIRPIVLEPRKKRKRQYSRGTQDIQVTERRLVTSARRVARAVERGLDTYLDERDKSADRRRDGAILDFIPNVGEGLTVAIREASPVASDLARALYPRRVRRMVRRRLRTTGRIIDSLLPW